MLIQDARDQNFLDYSQNFHHARTGKNLGHDLQRVRAFEHTPKATSARVDNFMKEEGNAPTGPSLFHSNPQPGEKDQPSLGLDRLEKQKNFSASSNEHKAAMKANGNLSDFERASPEHYEGGSNEEAVGEEEELDSSSMAFDDQGSEESKVEDVYPYENSMQGPVANNFHQSFTQNINGNHKIEEVEESRLRAKTVEQKLASPLLRHPA